MLTVCGVLESTPHTGDNLPSSAGRDVPKFMHESATYATLTHISHTIHSTAIAAARAAAIMAIRVCNH